MIPLLHKRVRKRTVLKETMHTSLLETQQMQDQASFSKITRRARRMASTPRKQITKKKDFVEKAFKKLTYKPPQNIAMQASLREPSVLASSAGQSIASGTTAAPDFCFDEVLPISCNITEYSRRGQYSASRSQLVHLGATSPVVQPQRVLTEAEFQQHISCQLHWQSLQPYSILLLSAFAMGAMGALANATTRPGPHLTCSGPVV